MRRRRMLPVVSALTALLSAPVGARELDRPGVPTSRAAPPAIEAMAIPAGSEPIRIDGVLSEELWANVPIVTAFVQRSPAEGAAPTHPTKIQVAFDQAALYIGVQALDDESGKVVGLLTRRDDSSPSDWVSILVDSYHDRRSAYEFGVNAAGVKYDRYWFNDTNNDMSWDAVWDVAVTRSADGWRAEFRIPFSQLRFNPSSVGTFGFAAVRTVAHVNETSTWPLLARSASGYVSSFGDLTGLTLTGAQKKLELVPYVVGQVGTAPMEAGNPLTRSPDPKATIGLDLKYKLAPGLTLTSTVNPDFGQVEADPAVVNLNGFETFFAERRPFFVEGSGNFAFDVDCNDGQCSGLFYSRRIGRTPQRAVDAPAGGFVTEPANSTILGAAKLTGRVGKFSVGALTAVTGNEQARVAAGPGLAITTTPVEPTTGYSAARASRDFSNHSHISFMATSTNRRLTDELTFLPSSAVTGGVEGDWRLARDRYSLAGSWAGSAVHGSTDAIAGLQQNYVHGYQRPDAAYMTFDPTRTSLSGNAGSLSFSKISGRVTRFNSNVNYKTPGFDISDLGYLQRADQIAQSNWYQIRDDTPGKLVRNYNVNFNQWAGWNFGGDRRSLGGNVNANWEFTNNWSAATGFNVNARGFDDRLTRGGPGGYVNGAISQWAYVQTDDRRRVLGILNFFWFTDRHGSRDWNVSPGVTWRPHSALSIAANVSYEHNLADTQWVENLGSGAASHYVFGRLNQATVGISARVNYTITPALTVQIYAQPFVSAGAYSQFKELVNGRADSYADRYAPIAYAGSPDFDYHSFRTTNVLRWEYRPGSALFLVWQQGREDTSPNGDFQFGRDLGHTFSAPATNVFLVKFSRWMSF